MSPPPFLALLLSLSCSPPGDKPPQIDSADSATTPKEITRFGVTERAGVSREDDFLQQGIPFSPGEVPSASTLGIRSAEGSWLPVDFQELAWWEDGSVRWALAHFPASIQPLETVSYGVWAGHPSAWAPAPSDLPPCLLKWRPPMG